MCRPMSHDELTLMSRDIGRTKRKHYNADLPGKGMHTDGPCKESGGVWCFLLFVVFFDCVTIFTQYGFFTERPNNKVSLAIVKKGVE